MGDPYDDLVDSITQLVEQDRREGAFCIGTVLRAGGGRLQVRRGDLPLERSDLWVNPSLDWRWTEDQGEDSLLRAGDRVILLTPDDQSYYLICKVVRP